jgi:outer membrane lipoprotein-sorting protein
MWRICGGFEWRMFVRAAVALALTVSAPVVHGQNAARPSAEQVMARMLEKNRERLAALEHYTTERTYQVNYAGTGGEHRAEIRVRAEYTGPEQKRFTVEWESGSKFICDKVLRKLVESEQEASDGANRMQSALSAENYDAKLVGEEMVEPLGTGTPEKAWVLEVTPRSASKFTYKGKVWVSEDDYAVMRIAGEPAKSPSWWIDRAHFDSRYVRRGQIWLPGRNVSSSHVRIGGEATLTIDYGSYPEVAARVVRPVGETVAANRTVVREPGQTAQ